jgi:hypothetical protein
MKAQFLDISENQKVREIVDFLYGTAPVITGTNLSRDEILDELRRRNPRKQFCIVKDWVLVELDIPEESRQQIEAQGFTPQFVHAHEVIEDSAGRFSSGWWVRTSLQLKYENDGFFETKSTIYVLTGDGRHKKLREDIAYSIRP